MLRNAVRRSGCGRIPSRDLLDVGPLARPRRSAARAVRGHRARPHRRCRTVVLPLTLIAGIYGMNFEHMPELRVPWGGYLTLGAMAGLAVVMLLSRSGAWGWLRGEMYPDSPVRPTRAGYRMPTTSAVLLSRPPRSLASAIRAVQQVVAMSRRRAVGRCPGSPRRKSALHARRRCRARSIRRDGPARRASSPPPSAAGAERTGQHVGGDRVVLGEPLDAAVRGCGRSGCRRRGRGWRSRRRSGGRRPSCPCRAASGWRGASGRWRRSRTRRRSRAGARRRREAVGVGNGVRSSSASSS